MRIVITGPESTGKTELAVGLADHYNGLFLPEYAREYILNLGRPYTKEDVLEIARYQIEQYKNSSAFSGIIFHDTWLVITRTWLEVLYQEYREWIDDALRTKPVDLFLLCAPDIPWVPDQVRENGGEMRVRLYDTYRNVLETFHLDYRIISGAGEERINKAIFAVDNLLRKPES